MEQGNDEQVANAAMAQARAEVAQMSLESLLKAGGKICWNVGNPMPSTSTNLLFGMVDTIHGDFDGLWMFMALGLPHYTVYVSSIRSHNQHPAMTGYHPSGIRGG